MRILIVEDDSIARKMMIKLLSDYGDCDIAVDGEEAVRAFRMGLTEKQPYDLILMDIMMPQMDGQEALLKIREMETNMGIRGSAEVKVIMVTALGDPRTVVHSYYKGGATAYLVKPVDKAKLKAEIRALGLIP